MWPRIHQAIKVINLEARIPILNERTGYGHFHHLLRINENFGKIDLEMPIGVVLDIPPEVEGGVQLPHRLDQWGAESAPAYRALIGLSSYGTNPAEPTPPRAVAGYAVLDLTRTTHWMTMMPSRSLTLVVREPIAVNCPDELGGRYKILRSMENCESTDVGSCHRRTLSRCFDGTLSYVLMGQWDMF